MNHEYSGDSPQGGLCPDSITAIALGILESPFPTRFDTVPTEDTKINIIFELGGDDFKADFDLLWEVPVTYRMLPEGDRLAWAEWVIENAQTDVLRDLTPKDVMQAYCRVPRSPGL